MKTFYTAVPLSLLLLFTAVVLAPSFCLAQEYADVCILPKQTSFFGATRSASSLVAVGTTAARKAAQRICTRLDKKSTARLVGLNLDTSHWTGTRPYYTSEGEVTFCCLHGRVEIQ